MNEAAMKDSQLRGDSSTLWQLIHVQVEGDTALQVEEAAAAAAAALLEDRLLSQIGCFAEEHQQMPVKEPKCMKTLLTCT